MQPCGQNCPRAKGHSAKKKFVLPIKSWFSLFSLFFLVMVEVLSQDPVNKKNFSSLMITNLELRFELCVPNLIWKREAKDPKKREDHLIFINFGIKKFTVKNTQKNKTLMFECYNILDPME
jgi:hypothetical protein